MGVGQDIIRKVILQRHLDCDFERYHYKAGDIARTLDGAVLICEYSAIDYINAFPIVRSISIRNKKFQRVPYTNLEYIKKGKYKKEEYPISKSINWKVGDIVEQDGFIVLLYEEVRHQQFYGYVLEAEQKYYIDVRVFIQNNFASYVVNKTVN